eukprot:scaffold138204_cov14-Tisochrysis_lutea.AAC.1
MKAVGKQNYKPRLSRNGRGLPEGGRVQVKVLAKEHHQAYAFSFVGVWSGDYLERNWMFLCKLLQYLQALKVCEEPWR